MPRPNSSNTGKRRRNRGRAKRSAPPCLSAEARSEIESVIGYVFNEPELLDRAFTHSSAVPGDAARHSNERLEFLGDRVLGLVVAQQLIQRFELEREGGLAPRLNALVSRVACAEVIAALGLGKHIIGDKSNSGAKDNSVSPSLLANLAEAIIGAIYLDNGLAPAEEFILENWKSQFQALQTKPSDPKSQLQEWAQGLGKSAPVYKEQERTGPDHNPVFTTSVTVQGFPPSIAVGRSKQDSERKAAQKLLEAIGDAK